MKESFQMEMILDDDVKAAAEYRQRNEAEPTQKLNSVDAAIGSYD
jgi:hypothetical protein